MAKRNEAKKSLEDSKAIFLCEAAKNRGWFFTVLLRAYVKSILTNVVRYYLTDVKTHRYRW